MGNMQNKAPHCIGCDDPLSEGNKSDAHIIPNALGGRLAPDDLICRTCNSVLDRAVDNALVKAFGGAQTLIGLPRQRGKNPSIDLRTESGKRVRVQPDGNLTLSEIQYDEKIEGDRRMITIGAPTHKQVGQLLERARKNNPELKDIDVNDILSKVQPTAVPVEESLLLRLDYSPVAIFGGVMVALWLFIAHRERHALENLQSMLSRLENINEHGGMFRYLPDGLPGLRGPQVDYSNKIIVRSIPQTGEMIGYVELLGTFRIGGIYAKSEQRPTALIEHVYVHDPFENKDRSAEFSIDSTMFEQVDWRTIGLGPVKQDAADLEEAMRVAGERLAEKYTARSAADDPTSGEK
tara:strand:+ start:2519 stop:3568 length:1050 start_codon:yes stop_codon:yes gene_type:complete